MSNEMMVQIRKSVDAGRSDATAILSSLGVVALMVRDAESLLEHGAEMALINDANAERAAKVGSETLADGARILKATREKMSAVLNGLGDYHNAHDTVSPTQENISTPVFAAFAKCASGKSLED